MSEKVLISFTPKVRAALAALKDIESKASKAGASFGGELAKSAKAAGKAVLLTLAGVAAGIKGISSGLNGLSDSLSGLLRNANAGFNNVGQSKLIKQMAGGFISQEQSFELGGLAESTRLTEDQTKKLTSLGVAAGIASTKMNSFEATKRIMESVLKGTPETLKDLPAISSVYNKIEKSLVGVTDKAKKQQIIISALMKNYKGLMAQLPAGKGNPLFDLASGLKELGEQLGNIMPTLKSMALIIGGVLAPLGAGLAGFALGPVVGVITTVVGGILSAGMGILAGKIVQDAAGDGGIANKLGALIDLLTNLFTVFTGALRGDKSVGSKMGKGVLETLGMSKKSAEETFKTVFAVGQFFGGFLDGFTLKLKEQWENIKGQAKMLAQITADLFGIKQSEDLTGQGKGIGEIFGKTVGEVTKWLLKMTSDFALFAVEMKRLWEFLSGESGSKFGEYLGKFITAPLKLLYNVIYKWPQKALGGIVEGLSRLYEWIMTTWNELKSSKPSPSEEIHGPTQKIRVRGNPDTANMVQDLINAGMSKSDAQAKVAEQLKKLQDNSRSSTSAADGIAGSMQNIRQQAQVMERSASNLSGDISLIKLELIKQELVEIKFLLRSNLTELMKQSF